MNGDTGIHPLEVPILRVVFDEQGLPSDAAPWCASSTPVPLPPAAAVKPVTSMLNRALEMDKVLFSDDGVTLSPEPVSPQPGLWDGVAAVVEPPSRRARTLAEWVRLKKLELGEGVRLS